MAAQATRTPLRAESDPMTMPGGSCPAASAPQERVGRIIQEVRPQRVTIQFETGDPFECRGVAGGVTGPYIKKRRDPPSQGTPFSDRSLSFAAEVALGKALAGGNRDGAGGGRRVRAPA